MELNASDQSNEKTTNLTNPHKLEKQLVGFIAWTGLIGIFAAGIPGVIISLILGGVTFADAWKNGIYKKPDSKDFLNISPMGWGIAMALLFIVAYPVYLIRRNKLRTIQAGNAYFVAVIIVGAIVIALTVLNILVAKGIIVAA